MCVNVNSATQGRRPYRDVPSFLPWLPRVCVCVCVCVSVSVSVRVRENM